LKRHFLAIRPFLHAIYCAVAVTALALAISASSAPTPQNSAGSFLDLNGSRLHYEECGAGSEALVLIHDGIAHSAVWDDVWGPFCKEFHTIRYDRPGYGLSAPASKWHTETDDLFALLRHLKIKRAMLVGSSHGGAVAINFTLAHPAMVEELVLVGAVVDGYGFSDHFFDRTEANQKPMEKNNVAGLIDNWANDKYVLAPDHPAARKKLHDLLTASPQDLTHQDLARDMPSALPRLHEIRVPSLILIGDADIPDVHAHAGVIETGIPNSRRVVIRDAGHLIYLELPGEFNRVVIRFLQENRN
jgi:3-oxoadipate enol-lactonase